MASQQVSGTGSGTGTGGVGGGGPVAPALAVKNFNQYYHAMRLCTGTAPTSASLNGRAIVTFQNDVLPILQSQCVSCHRYGGQATLQQGGQTHYYIFTTWEHLMFDQENTSRPVIVPGNAAASHLYTRVANGSMPPGAAALDASQIAIIRDWINSGAENTSNAGYFTSASLVLPQNTSPSSINDAGVQTAVKLASFFAQSFITAELAVSPASRRKALSSVNLSSPASFDADEVRSVVGAFIPLCLGRAATTDDEADAITAMRASLPTSGATAEDVKKALLVILTGILGSGEMMLSN